MSFIIAMDVSGDAPKEVIKQNDVRLLKMEYSVNGEMKICTGTEGRSDIKLLYDAQRNGDLTRTSQITPYSYQCEFEKLLKEGKSVLYLSLSSGLSSTYHSAQMAAAVLKEEYPDLDVMPLDTLAATGGMGVLLERAIRLRSEGRTLNETYEDLKNAASRLKHWFVVQDLMYLKRGGRVGAAEAVLGTALGIKPILIIDKEGRLEVAAKKRGAKPAAQEMLSRFREEYDPESGDKVYVVDADAPETADYLENELKSINPNIEVRRHILSPIIGAHTGPGMAAIIYVGKQ